MQVYNGSMQIYNSFSTGKRTNRSSIPEMFCKKYVLKNFTKFTGKHLCQSLFFNKVAGLMPATLLRKRLWQRCFPVNFAKFLRTLIPIEHPWWLLLDKVKLIRATGKVLRREELKLITLILCSILITTFVITTVC